MVTDAEFIQELIEINENPKFNNHLRFHHLSSKLDWYKQRSEQSMFDSSPEEVTGAVVKKHSREFVALTTNMPHQDGISFDVSTMRARGNEVFDNRFYQWVGRDL